MKKPSHHFVLLVFVIAGFSFSSTVMACKCPYRSLGESVKLADRAFIGVAVTVSDISPLGLGPLINKKNADDLELGRDYGISASFRIAFEGVTKPKGVQFNFRGFTDYGIGGNCSSEILIGKPYLVMADKLGELMICNATQSIEEYDCNELNHLKNILSGRTDHMNAKEPYKGPIDQEENTKILVEFLSGKNPLETVCRIRKSD